MQHDQVIDGHRAAVPTPALAPETNREWCGAREMAQPLKARLTTKTKRMEVKA